MVEKAGEKFDNQAELQENLENIKSAVAQALKRALNNLLFLTFFLFF